MIWINGRPAEFSGNDWNFRSLKLYCQTFFGARNAGCTSQTSPPIPTWDLHDNGQRNSFRLGECSDHGTGKFPRNYAADATIDEPYMFLINAPFKDNVSPQGIIDETRSLMKASRTLWLAGRYYRPTEDAIFTSAPIYPVPTSSRTLPPAGEASTLTETGTRVAVKPDGSGGQTRAGTTTTNTPKGSARGRVLGVAWTWYAEDYSRKDGAPLVFDYGQTRGELERMGGSPASQLFRPVKGLMHYSDEVQKSAPKILKQDESLCSVTVMVSDPQKGTRRFAGMSGKGLTDSGFSPLADKETGTPYVEFDQPCNWQYEVRFNIKELDDCSILLGTPVFDDITFYYSAEGPTWLSCAFVGIDPGL